jgi:hypothetical protein
LGNLDLTDTVIVFGTYPQHILACFGLVLFDSVSERDGHIQEQ